MKKAPIFILLLGIIFCFPACSRQKEPEKKVPEKIGMIVNERIVKDGVSFEDKNVGGMKESEVLHLIQSYAEKLDKEPVNAEISDKTWKIQDEKPGQKVNIQKSLEMVLNAEEKEKVKAVVEQLKPLVSSEDLRKNFVVIGSYTTPLLDRTDNRVNNIDLASERIDGIKIAPGEEFSFNRAVGKRTEAKGYEEAPIIIKTVEGPKKGTGVGGGICQVSSTLYNAVEEGGLEVTERHLHSKKVGYVPKGEDATVAYGSIDFKFRNNRAYPIMIRTYLKRKSLTVKIIENRN